MYPVLKLKLCVGVDCRKDTQPPFYPWDCTSRSLYAVWGISSTSCRWPNVRLMWYFLLVSGGCCPLERWSMTTNRGLKQSSIHILNLSSMKPPEEKKKRRALISVHKNPPPFFLEVSIYYWYPAVLQQVFSYHIVPLWLLNLASHAAEGSSASFLL